MARTFWPALGLLAGGTTLLAVNPPNATGIVAGLIVATAAAYGTGLYHTTGRVVRAARALLAEAEKQGVAGLATFGAEKHPLLRDAWRAYRASLVTDPRTGRLSGRVPAEEFFNPLALGRLVDLNVYPAIPGVLVGLGLYFTFLGLALALSTAGSGLAASDPAATRQALERLFSVAAFKFTTSLVAMACSLLFTLAERRRAFELQRALGDLCVALDRLFPPLPLEALWPAALSSALPAAGNVAPALPPAQIGQAVAEALAPLLGELRQPGPAPEALARALAHELGPLLATRPLEGAAPEALAGALARELAPLLASRPVEGGLAPEALAIALAPLLTHRPAEPAPSPEAFARALAHELGPWLAGRPVAEGGAGDGARPSSGGAAPQGGDDLARAIAATRALAEQELSAYHATARQLLEHSAAEQAAVLARPAAAIEAATQQLVAALNAETHARLDQAARHDASLTRIESAMADLHKFAGGVGLYTGERIEALQQLARISAGQAEKIDLTYQELVNRVVEAMKANNQHMQAFLHQAEERQGQFFHAYDEAVERLVGEILKAATYLADAEHQRREGA